MTRSIKDNLHGDKTLTIGSSAKEASVLVNLGTVRGRFPATELLDAIYEASPEHRPDGWKIGPEWADARVIEGYDNYGDPRLLVRSSSSGDWVTDAGVCWSQEDAERVLTHVRILVADDES